MTEQSNLASEKKVVGAIIAGGQSTRFGGDDKFFEKLGGKSLIGHVVERVQPQTEILIINSNSDAALFDRQSLPVVSDSIAGFAGPLAGILAGMDWVRKNHPSTRWMATFPSDAPFIPLDCVKKMLECAENDDVDIVCAASNGRMHPVCALWYVGLAPDLRRSMLYEDMRKIDLWTVRHKLSTVKFSNSSYDPFFNINRPEDLKCAEDILNINLKGL